jgi:hypothetical protein
MEQRKQTTPTTVLGVVIPESRKSARVLKAIKRTASSNVYSFVQRKWR